MRIAIDMTTQAGGTGIPVYARSLARALERTGEVELIRLYPPWRELSVPRRIWWEQVLLPRQAARRGARLLHHSGFCCSLWASLPRVLTVHDLLPLDHPEETPSAPARFYWRWLLPRSLRSADRLVAVSGATRDRVEALIPERAGDLRVIHSALPVGRGKGPDPHQARHLRASLGIREPYVLAVGSILPRKDHPTLVRAFARLVADGRHPELRLVLAGGVGPGLPALQAAITEAGLGERIRHVADFDDAVLEALYSAASALAFPSIGEGFGFPPLEAMAHGVPVVACRATSVPEVVGEAARLHAPGDDAELAALLEEVLTDGERRAQLAAAGHRRLQELTWERAAAAYLEIYRALLGEG